MSPPPQIYSAPAGTYRSSATTAVTSTMAVPVTGRAKLMNQWPWVAQLIYSRYTPMTKKSTGTKITGLGRLNHRGSTTVVYSSTSPPTT